MSEATLRLGLVGSPNSGKTTLFNSLTGLRAKVGNYPGVTVERREGEASIDGRSVVVIDLPGTYSLTPISEDELVVTQLLSGELADVEPPDALVVVADACTLERSLLLVAQVLRIDRPTCVVLTMVDELAARGGQLNLQRLGDALGVPVVPVVGHRGIGLDALKRLLGDPARWSRPPVRPPEDPIERGQWAASVLANVLQARPGRSRTTDAIDRVLLHPVLGTLVFVTVMVLFFQLIFAWAQPAMDAIDGGMGALSSLLRDTLPDGVISNFLVEGIVGGVGSVIIFLPQILLVLTMLHLLEDLGYMARAAFVIDRVMGWVGLEGRSFVALLSSFACAVPGIMATRTIPSPRDRLVTILVSPLMTCSARLPVYALLIAAFVPDRSVIGPLGLQGLVLLGLYFAGAITALVVAAIFKRSLFRGEGLPFYMELPPYRVPTAKLLLTQVWGGARSFLKRAGTIILLVSMVLWVLLNVPKVEAPSGLGEEAARSYAMERSVAGQLGHAVEPVLAPLGFDWKIGVGLLASLAAREVIVATLAQIYAATDEDASLREAIRADQRADGGGPVFTPATVGALLVFFVFALQCTSTLAVMRRETNSWRWPAFAFSYLLALAYGASYLTYRVVNALWT